MILYLNPNKARIHLPLVKLPICGTSLQAIFSQKARGGLKGHGAQLEQTKICACKKSVNRIVLQTKL